MEESIQQFDLILMNRMEATTPSKDLYGDLSDGRDEDAHLHRCNAHHNFLPFFYPI